MPNSHLFHTQVAVISKDASIEEAAKVMRDHHVGSVVVVESSPKGGLEPVGLLTDRDIVIELISLGISPDEVSVKDIMTPSPVTASHTASLHEVIQIMQKSKVRRLPIVDAKNLLVGFVSFDDLIENLGKEMANLSQITHAQQQVEKNARPPREAVSHQSAS